MGRGESSSLLRAESGVPVGLLNPGLLDGATHGIPHADLHTWNEASDPGKVAFPAFIPEIDFFGPTPVAGTVRCEVRQQPFFGSPDYPVFLIQLIGPDGVWCQLRLVESCFPKGPLGSADPAARRAFLRDRAPVEGLRLSRVEDGVTVLTDAEVAATDWLPGTVAAVYGSRETEEIARAEHAAAAHALHPGRVFAQLPLTRFDLEVERDGRRGARLGRRPREPRPRAPPESSGRAGSTGGRGPSRTSTTASSAASSAASSSRTRRRSRPCAAGASSTSRTTRPASSRSSSRSSRRR